MMKIWNATEIKNRILFLVFVCCCFSCTDNGVQEFEYHYNIYDSAGNIKGYFKRTSFTNKSNRTDTIYRYNKLKELNNTRIEKYSFDENSLKNQRGSIILSIKDKDSCINYTDINDNEFESCYLGIFPIDRAMNKTLESYKFEQTELSIDGVTKIQFFDENFILVKEEFQEGTVDYYRIELTDPIDGLMN